MCCCGGNGNGNKYLCGIAVAVTLAAAVWILCNIMFVVIPIYEDHKYAEMGVRDSEQKLLDSPYCDSTADRRPGDKCRYARKRIKSEQWLKEYCAVLKYHYWNVIDVCEILPPSRIESIIQFSWIYTTLTVIFGTSSFVAFLRIIAELYILYTRLFNSPILLGRREPTIHETFDMNLRRALLNSSSITTSSKPSPPLFYSNQTAKSAATAAAAAAVSNKKKTQ